MTETIGKVTLNLDKYPGEDYYCDGSVEDEILDIVKKYSIVEYDRIIAERKEITGIISSVCHAGKYRGFPPDEKNG